MSLENTILDAVLKRIDEHCQTTGVSASDFGEKAMNDRGFVFSMRDRRRSPSLKTLDKAMKYMCGNSYSLGVKL